MSTAYTSYNPEDMKICIMILIFTLLSDPRVYNAAENGQFAAEITSSTI